MRLDRFLSNLRFGTRSEIKEFAKAGDIVLNGKVVYQCSLDIKPNIDNVVFRGEKVFYKEKLYLMLNKPKGYLCANHDSLHKTVIELIKAPYNRFEWIIVGRLDLDTEGLLFLTTDGAWAHQMASPKKNTYKKYYVELRDPLENFHQLEKGVTILDGRDNPYVTQPARITPISSKSCYIEISEGKFHQVKRMFAYINNEVIYLNRVSIGDFVLDKDLSLGEYKEIDVKG